MYSGCCDAPYNWVAVGHASESQLVWVVAFGQSQTRVVPEEVFQVSSWISAPGGSLSNKPDSPDRNIVAIRNLNP